MRSVFLETITFPNTRAMSGSSRGSLNYWRKNRDKASKRNIDTEFTKAAAKLPSIPTKRSRNNQRVRKEISLSKRLYKDFSEKFSRKNAAEWAKSKRRKLKQSQIDHTIYNYPLIEGVLSGASRAFLKISRSGRKKGHPVNYYKRLLPLIDKIPTNRKRNNFRHRKYLKIKDKEAKDVGIKKGLKDKILQSGQRQAYAQRIKNRRKSIELSKSEIPK